MALREFADQSGRQWRVWDVTEQNIHPRTRGEDWMRDFLDGWLTFESVDGQAKCRLHPIPANWEAVDDAQLERWLHDAEPVRGDRSSGPVGRGAIEDAVRESETVAAGGTTPPRMFRFPGGRLWTVGIWTTQLAGRGGTTSSSVLRFNSGNRSLDLADWPVDWQEYSDTQLAELLSLSFPRPENQANPTPYRRRASDAR